MSRKAKAPTMSSTAATVTPNSTEKGESARVVFSEANRSYVFTRSDETGFDVIKLAVGDGRLATECDAFLAISDFGMLDESDVAEFFGWITSSKYFGLRAVTGALPTSSTDDAAPVWLTAETMTLARTLIARNLPSWLCALVAMILADATEDIDGEEFFTALSTSVPKVTLNRVTGATTVESFARLVRTVGLESAASASRRVATLENLGQWVQLVEGRNVKLGTDFNAIGPDALVRLCAFIDAIGERSVSLLSRDFALWSVLPSLMTRLDDTSWRQAGRIQAVLLTGDGASSYNSEAPGWVTSISSVLNRSEDEVKGLFDRMFVNPGDRVRLLSSHVFRALFGTHGNQSAFSDNAVLHYMLFATMLSAYGIDAIDAAHRSISVDKDENPTMSHDLIHLIAVIEMGSFGEAIDRDATSEETIESILGVIPHLAYTLMLGE